MNTDDKQTPRTDALDRELHNPRIIQDRYSEMADHARTLELESAALRQRVEELTRRLESNTATLLNLRADLKAGRYIHGDQVIDNLKLVADLNSALLSQPSQGAAREKGVGL